MLNIRGKAVDGDLVFVDSDGNSVLRLTPSGADPASRYSLQYDFLSAEVSGSKFAVAPSAGTIVGVSAVANKTASACVFRVKYQGSALAGGSLTIATGATTLNATSIIPSGGNVLAGANQVVEVESLGNATSNHGVIVTVTIQT